MMGVFFFFCKSKELCTVIYNQDTDEECEGGEISTIGQFVDYSTTASSSTTVFSAHRIWEC